MIEAPFSVIKELVENSLDAGATSIKIAVESSGLAAITISDNGQGIAEEDFPLACKKHATSKITSASDLSKISSFGFRGEALSSISSIAHLTISSATEGSRVGKQVEYSGETILNSSDIPAVKGTTMIVKDLFYNTPVRKKFLKNQTGEDSKNKEIVTKLALANPNIHFTFVSNGKTQIEVFPEPVLNRIQSLFGKNFQDRLILVENDLGKMKIMGYVGDADLFRSNRNGQYFFVNSRPVEIKNLSYFLKKAYDELIPEKSFPYAFLFLEIDPKLIDVNVHPQKKEIRFVDEEYFQSVIFQTVHSALRKKIPVEYLEMKHRLSNASLGAESRNTKEDSGKTSESLLNLFRNEASLGISHALEERTAGTNLEALTTNFERSREFIPLKHFGIFFETFILAEAVDGIYIIDQHTAHERIRYEEVLNQLKEKSYQTTDLLTPIEVLVPKQDLEDVLKLDWASSGFRIQKNSDSSFQILSVPNLLKPGTERETVLDMIDRSKAAPTETFYDAMAKSLACMSAVKHGDLNSPAIISELLNRLSYTSNPTRCPHGRPTLIKITKHDLEKIFHRT